jgi:hypothetical protein
MKKPPTFALLHIFTTLIMLESSEVANKTQVTWVQTIPILSCLSTGMKLSIAAKTVLIGYALYKPEKIALCPLLS